MYQALYRKYRPTTFDEVVGQRHITVTLKNEVATGKTSHAYLFTGSRGTGKTSCSKILAKAVNCLNLQEGNPCGACEICRGVDEGSMLDVTEIDAASNNGVDNIRQLREEAYFLPAQARMRVYIIDETHMLSTGAFNALLKIMEEPPEHVLFILATTEAHKVPATILSRCQRFDFKRIPSEEISGRLVDVARREGLSLTPDAALLIARLADGGMRDALSLLDLCASRGKEIDAVLAADAAGLAGQEHLAALADAVASADAGAALETLDSLYVQGADLERLCGELVSYFRSLMICKSARKPEELVVALPEELARMKGQAQRMGHATVLHALTVLQEVEGRIARASSRRAELELALIRLCDARLDSTPEAILRRLEALEAQMKAGGVPAMQPQQTQPPEKKTRAAKQPEASDEAGAGDENDGQAPPQAMAAEPPSGDAQPMPEWAGVLVRLAKSNPALCGTLRGSTAYVNGDICLIDAKDALFFKLIRENEISKRTLREAISQETGRAYRLGPYKREETAQAEQKRDPMGELEQLARDAGIPLEMK